MAPDLLAMCDAAPGAATSERVAAGQAHHLSVDAAFHASPAFVAIQSWTSRALIAAGLRRGPARGAAHVAVELILDGVLSSDASACAAYRRALASAVSSPDPFAWPERTAGERWRRLLERLRSGAIPQAYRDPLFVARRVTGALARRPRLALDTAEEAALVTFLPVLHRRVTADAPALVPA